MKRSSMPSGRSFCCKFECYQTLKNIYVNKLLSINLTENILWNFYLVVLFPYLEATLLKLYKEHRKTSIQHKTVVKLMLYYSVSSFVSNNLIKINNQLTFMKKTLNIFLNYFIIEK